MGVRHEVLNAKNHEREAGIVAQAGRKGAVTVSTNMAGRGTDILLGGNPEFMTKDECLKKKVAERLTEDEAQFVADEHFYYFTHHDQFYRVRRDKWDELYAAIKAETDKEHDEVVALGGLHIVATERHESRRIDNQLRGRAGRQGDPGSSRFFLSLQDDLLRIFGGERMQNLMLRLGMEEDVPIESKLITKRIARRRRPSKRRTSKPANTCWNTTTSTTSSARPSTACAASCSKASTRRSTSWRWCRASSSSSSTCAVPTTSTPTPGTWPRCATTS